MTNLQILQALAFEPRKAFAAIAARPTYAFPLLLVAITTAVVTFWYRSVVDLEWLTDLTLRSNETIRGMMTDEQIAERAAAAASSGTLSATLTAIGTALGVLVGYLISGLYFLLAGKITGLKYSFRQWFALSAWVSLPTMLTLLAGAFMLMGNTSDQIPPDAIQPLSLNALYFNKEMGESGYALYTNIQLPMILTTILSLLAVKEWSQRSWLFTTIFTLLPTALILGIVAIFMLGRS